MSGSRFVKPPQDTLRIREVTNYLGTATSKGFRIYHTDPFSRIFSSDEGNTAIIEMLFSTSLVALTLTPRHLIIQNTKVRRRLDFLSLRTFDC